MYLSIIILPLLGSIVSGFFGRKIGITGTYIISCLCVITTTILAITAFIEVGFNNNPISINLFNWVDSEFFNMMWTFYFDSLTVSMLLPVLIISSLVHFYSIGYMSHDPHNQRFFSYLSLFTFMMIILVTGNNYFLMFVGWEGVGVCSYLLVSFWYTRIAANQSSLAAFLTNRVGDCFLTIGMFFLLWALGSLDYSKIFSLSPYINENLITMIGVCLVIGAMAKSSQVGLHIWLPMAMEGPTPVSALIHAATMVTAGVYLLIRSSPLIEYSSTVLLICLWLGAITTVFSSLVGFFQQDIKKIIAYSTMSQLGMMVIAVGLSSYNVAIFHLINHAFYKGLLFLGAGAVIHAVADNQDLRKYGGLRSFLPLTYTVILIASLSLVALPFMAGYYSKDFILESAYGQFNFSSVSVYIIAVIGAIFTTLYSVKVLHLTFLAKANGPINSYKNAHEGDLFLSLPLVVLAIFSIYFGYLTKDIFIGLASGFFNDNSIFIHPFHEILIDTEFAVPILFKLIPFMFTIGFSTIAIVYLEFLPNSINNFKLSNLGYYIFGFFNQRFLVEFFYNKYIVKGILDLGGQTTKSLDKGSVEAVGPSGFYILLLRLSKSLSSLHQGIAPIYALYIVLAICLYSALFFFNGNVAGYMDISQTTILVVLFISLYIALFVSNKITEKSTLILESSFINFRFIIKILKILMLVLVFFLTFYCLFTIFFYFGYRLEQDILYDLLWGFFNGFAPLYYMVTNSSNDESKNLTNFTKGEDNEDSFNSAQGSDNLNPSNHDNKDIVEQSENKQAVKSENSNSENEDSSQAEGSSEGEDSNYENEGSSQGEDSNYENEGSSQGEDSSHENEQDILQREHREQIDIFHRMTDRPSTLTGDTEPRRIRVDYYDEDPQALYNDYKYNNRDEESRLGFQREELSWVREPSESNSEKSDSEISNVSSQGENSLKEGFAQEESLQNSSQEKNSSKEESSSNPKSNSSNVSTESLPSSEQSKGIKRSFDDDKQGGDHQPLSKKKKP